MNENEFWEIKPKKLPGYLENIPDGFKKVIYISWEEWEPGFWVRPDGCTLSMTEEDAKKFVDKYSDSMEHPAGEPVPVYVAPELYEEMKSKEYGTIWVSRSEEAKFVKERKLIYTEKRSGWVFRGLSGMDNNSKQ